MSNVKPLNQKGIYPEWLYYFVICNELAAKISHILLIGCRTRGDIVYVLLMIGYKMVPPRARSFTLTMDNVFFLYYFVTLNTHPIYGRGSVKEEYPILIQVILSRAFFVI